MGTRAAETTPERVVSRRELNRWTLARQHLLERAPLDVTTAIEGLAGMQAQHPPSPYIGLWSRLAGFERLHLEEALSADRVLKATLMRGTLHLISAGRLGHYRVGAGSAGYDLTSRQLRELGADLDAIRALVVAEVSRRAHSRAEVSRLIAGYLPGDAPAWVGERVASVAAVSVTTDLVNLAEDAAFDYAGGARYRVTPAAGRATVDPEVAFRQVATDYLAAYGPATRADLARWSGKPVGAFAGALDQLDLVCYQAEDGRLLLDLGQAPRPPADVPAPVRFLPKWDSLLLAHDRRDRVLPEAYRRLVIAKNGDVAPTFLVDGTVAGTWAAPRRRGRAFMRLTALGAISVRARRAVEAEARRLIAWLRPDTPDHEVGWG